MLVMAQYCDSQVSVFSQLVLAMNGTKKVTTCWPEIFLKSDCLISLHSRDCNLLIQCIVSHGTLHQQIARRYEILSRHRSI